MSIYTDKKYQISKGFARSHAEYSDCVAAQGPGLLADEALMVCRVSICELVAFRLVSSRRARFFAVLPKAGTSSLYGRSF